MRVPPVSAVPAERVVDGALAAPRHDLLIVEPEAAAADHAVVLRREYRVAVATDSDAAMQYLKRGASPGLVFVDVDTSGDGIDLTRAAKTLRTPSTVLVATSQPMAVPDLLDAGCDAVLVKPFASN
jgi:CheY-like chemotaxis protein